MKQINAEMVGTVVAILVEEGEMLRAQQDVVIMESMKMEIPMITPSAGIVRKICVEAGQFVNEGDPLVFYETESKE